MPKINQNKHTSNTNLPMLNKSTNDIQLKNHKKSCRPFKSFIRKLFTICNDPEIKEIAWNSKGDSVLIYYSESLCNVIFPKYFKHSSWNSFTRQLNMYGFIRQATYSMDNALTFLHPLFIRNRPDLMFNIQRKVINHNINLVAKPYKSNNNDTLMNLNNKVLQANKELMEVKQQLYDMNTQNQRQKEIINHNQSSINHIKNLLTQIQNNSNNDKHLSLELNIAIRSLELSLNFNHHKNSEPTKSPMLSSNIALSPVYSTSPNHNLRLPSINHLLKDLDTSHV